ncbi:MAG: DUF3144 domain-containing protein [Bauldia sp.]|nr:DUF3144 domain-containing protein [Bauldia sp.]
MAQPEPPKDYSKPYTNDQYVALANKFIGYANDEGKKTIPTNVQAAFLFAAARYTAFMARKVVRPPDDAAFIEDVTKNFRRMLTEQMADKGFL